MRPLRIVLFAALAMVGLVAQARLNHVNDLHARQALYPAGGRWQGPRGEAKVGKGDRFKDGDVFPRGAGVGAGTESRNDTTYEFETILNHNEIRSALKGLRKEYGIQLADLPHTTFAGRTATLGMKPCTNSRSTLPGRCELPASYKALFTAGIHGRERSTPDSIIYFLSDLLYAEKHATGLDYGNVSFTNDQVQEALSVGIVFFPMVNEDGLVWDHVKYDCWRRNRNNASAHLESARPWSNYTIGVDINRNFDFAFNFSRVLNASVAGRANSADPRREMFQGPEAMSEAETKNVAWVFDAFPGLAWFMDIHTLGRHILHPWSLDLNQHTEPEQSWRNEEYDGMRGDIWSDEYGEYMRRADDAKYRKVSSRIADAMEEVVNISHSAGESSYLHVHTGDVMDWAYARHIVDRHRSKVMAFTMEFGEAEPEALARTDEICPFYPTKASLNVHMREAAVGFMTFLLEAAEHTD